VGPRIWGSGNQVDPCTALQSQLGLKLEPGKGAVEVIVIDHMQKKLTRNQLGCFPVLAVPTGIAPIVLRDSIRSGYGALGNRAIWQKQVYRTRG
jgi:hypothetical protein